jgi:hypothetical protein
VREIIGLIVGLYLTAALVVFGGAGYGFMSGEHKVHSNCPPSWSWAAYRAALWPKTYFDDTDKVLEFSDWLLVHYNPFTEVCGN